MCTDPSPCLRHDPDQCLICALWEAVPPIQIRRGGIQFKEVNVPEVMTQVAPYPAELERLVKALEYRPGWEFRLTHDGYDRGQGSKGLSLIITVTTINSYPPHEPIRIGHLMIVPAASYDRRSWRRWLFEQILLVERHEACEFFTIDGDKPYAPSHGPGNDPYMIREIGTDLDRRTSFRGEVEPA